MHDSGDLFSNMIMRGECVHIYFSAIIVLGAASMFAKFSVFRTKSNKKLTRITTGR